MELCGLFLLAGVMLYSGSSFVYIPKISSSRIQERSSGELARAKFLLHGCFEIIHCETKLAVSKWCQIDQVRV